MHSASRGGTGQPVAYALTSQNITGQHDEDFGLLFRVIRGCYRIGRLRKWRLVAGARLMRVIGHRSVSKGRPADSARSEGDSELVQRSPSDSTPDADCRSVKVGEDLRLGHDADAHVVANQFGCRDNSVHLARPAVVGRRRRAGPGRSTSSRRAPPGDANGSMPSRDCGRGAGPALLLPAVERVHGQVHLAQLGRA